MCLGVQSFTVLAPEASICGLSGGTQPEAPAKISRLLGAWTGAALRAPLSTIRVRPEPKSIYKTVVYECSCELVIVDTESATDRLLVEKCFQFRGVRRLHGGVLGNLKGTEKSGWPVSEVLSRETDSDLFLARL